jgi:hypothetical protein
MPADRGGYPSRTALQCLCNALDKLAHLEPPIARTMEEAAPDQYVLADIEDILRSQMGVDLPEKEQLQTFHADEYIEFVCVYPYFQIEISRCRVRWHQDGSIAVEASYRRPNNQKEVILSVDRDEPFPPAKVDALRSEFFLP